MLDACSQVECVSTTTGVSSTDDEPEFLMKSPRVTTIARKQLATAVRDLMQHGLIQASTCCLKALSLDLLEDTRSLCCCVNRI